MSLVAAMTARTANAQPAATQPATTAAQIEGLIDSLRQSVRSLEAQVDSLKAENAALRRQLAEVQRVAAAAPTPSRVAEPTEPQPSSSNPAPAVAPEPTLQKGMTYRQARELHGEPTSVGERDGRGSREVIWKTHRGGDSTVTGVIIAEIDAKGVVREFTEARDRP
jgi:hypothetical protein